MYKEKYLKYKNKYLDLKQQIGGSDPISKSTAAGGGSELTDLRYDGSELTNLRYDGDIIIKNLKT